MIYTDNQRHKRESASMVRLVLSLIFSAIAITSVLAAESVTYICIEERSVGWESRENEPDVIGQFNPSRIPQIVTFYPAAFEGGKVKTIPRIEITQEGKTSTFTSNACSDAIAYIIRDRLFGTHNDIDMYLQSCTTRLKDPILGIAGFGTDNHRWAFAGAPNMRESPIQYTESLVVGMRWAYLNRGSCTFAR